MLLVHRRFAISMFIVNDDNCVEGDDDSNDNDIKKKEKCKIRAQI
jgi:hypothetical protein